MLPRPSSGTMISLKRVTRPPVARGLAGVMATLTIFAAGAVAATTQGQVVTDTTIIAMVNDRPITVRAFCTSYFALPSANRPNPDSLGRVEHLQTLVTKEILGISALSINRPLDFADRSALRAHRNEALANILYQRLVEDSVHVTEDDLRAAHSHFGYDVRVRQLRFSERMVAERVRRDLIAGRTTWDAAGRQFALDASEPGWVRRRDVSITMALKVFSLVPGQVSEVIADGDGAHLYQVLERRNVGIPLYQALRRYLWIQLRSAKAIPYAERLNALVRNEMAVSYDTTSIRLAASRMGDTRGMRPGPDGPVIEVTPRLPDFAPEELDLVVVRWRDGQLTLGEVIARYATIAPLYRGSLDSFEAFRAQIDGMIFGPTMAGIAERLGLESDSLAQAVLKRKLEALHVEYLFSDSVESKIRPTEDELRAFHAQNPHYFMAPGRARWVGIPRDSREGAVALLARLRAGEDPAVILREDSLAGRPVGSFQERAENERGPYHDTVFGDLRPGEVTTVGPHGDGSYAVLQLISREPSRPRSYDEALAEVAAVVRAVQTEKQLGELVERLARGMNIRTRPELLMRFDLTDPADEIEVH
jgi:hypothetical protein